MAPKRHDFQRAQQPRTTLLALSNGALFSLNGMLQEQGGKGAGLPLGKQGVLITVENADSLKASLEALTVLTEVYEELLQTLPADATAAATVKPSAGSAAEPAPADVTKPAEAAAASAAAQPSDGTAAADALPSKDAVTKPEAAVAPANTSASAAPAEEAASTSAAEAKGAQGAKADGAPAAAGASADYSSLIAQEISGLKDKKQQHFVFHDTGIRTLFFLEMPTARPGAGPCEVVKFMLEKGLREKNLQFRFCTRFLPCTHICKADKATIAETAKQLVQDKLDCSEGAKEEKVAVQYEHRAAPKELTRADVIDVVVEPVPRPPHKVDLRNPTKTLSCQVVRTACGLAVLDEYNRLGKYNIKTVTQQPAELEDKE